MSFLHGYHPVQTHSPLFQFSPYADRQSFEKLLGSRKSYKLLHIMTKSILAPRNSTRSATRSRDMKCPANLLRHDTLTILIGWTQSAREDTARVVSNLFCPWSAWRSKPRKCSDAGCTNAFVRYQHATAFALRAGPSVGVAPGECIRRSLGDYTLIHHASSRIDQMLKLKMPHELAEDAPFRGRMQAEKHLGADISLPK